ncbi:transposase, isxo2-like domain-containing protein [Plakobranchus ocellatus]|uniref:Transposase, isxo2-like domain-containing protein n=1 Tax=Plakobranchus ocellatus TaxID=259542 RepID=A0AAV3Z7Q9_9GAST|nr:transposase, isxo2-like domain-containing protein [Plakobranchus ocellatus]
MENTDLRQGHQARKWKQDSQARKRKQGTQDGKGQLMNDDGDSDLEPQIVFNSKVRKEAYHDVVNFTYLNDCTRTEDDCLQFCQHYGLLPKTIHCHKCGVYLVKLQKNSRGKKEIFCFRCNNRSCRASMSVKRNTWFHQSRIDMKKNLILTYMFVMQADLNMAIRETSGPSFNFLTTSTETVTDLYTQCRKVCAESLYGGNDSWQIGGTNYTVELDITSFGKREFVVGRQVQTHHVVAGICRESDQCFFVPIENLSEDDVLGVIVKRVEQGTIIITEASPLYMKIPDLGYRHRVSTNSCFDKDQASNNSTNLVKATVSSMKKHMPTNVNKKNINGYLAELLWRRQNKDKKCLFVSFLKEVARLYPGL